MDDIIVCRENIALLKNEYYHIVENNLKKQKIENVGISSTPLGGMSFYNTDISSVLSELDSVCAMKGYCYITKTGSDVGLILGALYKDEIRDTRYVAAYLVSYDESDPLRLIKVGTLDEYKLKESSYMLNLSATVSRNIAVDKVDATNEIKEIQNKIKDAREKGLTFVFHPTLTIATKELLKLRHFSFQQTDEGVQIIW